ncbi:MAG: hypothetical protein KJN63_07340 [Acidimicrobiia bacterium]|nr:hypothetical protein [Acidimicrobiia bacterium]
MSNRVLTMILVALVGACGFLGWRTWELTQTDLSEGVALSSPPITEVDAAPSFLRAWKTAETTNYIAFAKVGLTGNGLAAFTEDIVVQRNGQRLVNRDSSIIYERDGETETCRQTRRELFCTPAAPVPTAEDREAQLRELLTGENWSYRAEFSPQSGCYQLRLDVSRGPVTPEYGLEADYCFDPMTGAMKSKVVRKVNRTESYEASEISNNVEESDLRGVFPVAILERFFQ